MASYIHIVADLRTFLLYMQTVKHHTEVSFIQRCYIQRCPYTVVSFIQRCPLYRGVLIQRCPLYRGVLIQRCPLYIGVLYTEASFIQRCLLYKGVLNLYGGALYQRFHCGIIPLHIYLE